MDKGLDIDAYHCSLALHAPLHYRPSALAKSIDAIFSASRAQLPQAALVRRTEVLARKLSLAPDWLAADRALRWMQDGGTILTLGDPRYPSLLKEIDEPPPMLFVRGDPNWLAHPQIALVGSRNATPGGRETAHLLAGELSQCGFVITSGLARGIDAAAHAGALAVAGGTIAVSGTGIDRIYPRTNAALAREIAERGAVVSELPLGAPPRAGNFPRRNRIICGLAVGTVVVEAALNSGSLITARQTVELGREVFAVPGAIRNPLARGCHWLLRQGATLVETSEDVVAALPTYRLPSASKGKATAASLECGSKTLSPDSPHALVLNSCAFEPTSVDSIAHNSGLTMNLLSSILLELELAGTVRSLPGGYYERTGVSSAGR